MHAILIDPGERSVTKVKVTAQQVEELLGSDIHRLGLSSGNDLLVAWDPPAEAAGFTLKQFRQLNGRGLVVGVNGGPTTLTQKQIRQAVAFY